MANKSNSLVAGMSFISHFMRPRRRDFPRRYSTFVGAIDISTLRWRAASILSHIRGFIELV
jgi:hypothetical protein